MMKNTRMSRKNHGTGREGVKQVDHSGLRGTKTLNQSVLQENNPHTPKRYRAFGSTNGDFSNPSIQKRIDTPTVPTGAPVASEMVDGGKEGPGRGRKSSL